MSNEPQVTVKISGLDLLQKALEDMPKEVCKKGLRAALRAGGNVMEEGFVENAPADTGFLREHFNQRMRIKGDDVAGSVFIGPDGKADYPDRDGTYREKINAKTGKTKKVGRISVVSVVRFLEFGTTKMAKKPFMTQTWESRKEQALDAIVNKLRDVVETAAKVIGGRP